MPELDFETWKVILTVFTVLAVIVGWVVVHVLTAKRDAENKRREITLKYMISAYRILTQEVSHRKPTDERREKLENLLSDIQLFGTESQVRLAIQLANEVANGGAFELDPLIKNLRNNLRDELGLGVIKENVKWLRFNE